MPLSKPNEIEVKPCLRSYVTMACIFLPLAIFGLFVAVKTPAHDWRFVYIPTALGIFSMIWLRVVRLKIAGGEFSYRTLFGIRSIKLADIERVETGLVGTSKGPYRALVIYPLAQVKQRPIRINIGGFSREDLRNLFDIFSPVFKGPREIGIYTDESI